jgi:hypothetical protein
MGWKPLPLPRREGLFWIAGEAGDWPAVSCFRHIRRPRDIDTPEGRDGPHVWGVQRVDEGSGWRLPEWERGETWSGTHWIEVKRPTHPAEASEE